MVRQGLENEMRVIDLNCPNCGANMKANGELKKAICNFCGHEILIDDERIDITISNGKQFGYDQEIGRQIAKDERYEKFKKQFEYFRMKLSLQYLIDMKSTSFFAGKSGYFFGTIIGIVAIFLACILGRRGQLTITLLFALACGICFYITSSTNQKIDKMKDDLSNNNFMNYMDEIKPIMEKRTIIVKAEEMARREFGDI